ncbi:MAG: class I SAM-dependent methyltransferase [Candidatus Aminicenantia bacterium]
MSGVVEKKHYYDGLFYEKFVDTILQEIRDIIYTLVEDYSSVVDIGCGTGALVFQLSKKCQYVVGIELSAKMIQRAIRRMNKNNFKNVEFLKADAAKLGKFSCQEFDYAIACMVIHELPVFKRDEVLNEMKRIAKKVIIVDYTVPLPLNLAGVTARFIEFLAGIDHFKNFRTFILQGGLPTLLNQNGFNIECERSNMAETLQIIKAK